MSDWIDITRVLHDGQTGWPGDPPFRLCPVADLAADGAHVTEIRMSAHIGTHVDAPLHCLADGCDVADLGLDRLYGAAVVVQATPGGEVGQDGFATADIRPGDRVLLRTGSAAAMAGGPGQEDHVEVAPPDQPPPIRGISPGAAQWLVDVGVVLFGTDEPSPDPPTRADLPAHRILLGAGVPILENLDLGRVAPGRYELIVLPLPIRGGEAAPARAILRADRPQ